MSGDNIFENDLIRRCKNCRFYYLGDCRRYPPQITDQYRGRFPTTQDYQWCGEFQVNKIQIVCEPI